MKWISVKEKPFPLDRRLLVTNGRDLGHILVDQYHIKEWEENEIGYQVGGIPDHTSHSMHHVDITHWCLIPELPKDSQ